MKGWATSSSSHIRESDAICQVTRVFRDDDITHVDGEVSPKNDIETISTELILADLQTIENALPRLDKDAKRDKDLAAAVEAAKKAQDVLEAATASSRPGSTPTRSTTCT